MHAGHTQGIARLMGNYTSLLWLFNIKRSAFQGTPARGVLTLDNVRLVLPELELRVSRLHLQTLCSLTLNPQTRILQAT